MIITVSGPLGVGEAAFVAGLSECLGLPVLDRETIRAALGQAPLAVPSDDADELVPSETGFRAWFGGDRTVGAKLATELLGLIGERPMVVVGWGGADVLRSHPQALHIRLIAEPAERAKRVGERTDSAPETAYQVIEESDEHRADFHRRLFGADWTDVRRYHLVLNTSRLGVSGAVGLAAKFAAAVAAGPAVGSGPSASWHCLTISRQFGAGGSELGELLATRLGWPCWDRQILHQSGELEGITTPQLIRLDERGPEFLERLHILQDSARYFEGLQAALANAVSQGPAILVGRGANFLVPDEKALHLRLVADDTDRLQRVMRRRWLAAPAASALIRTEDLARAEFHRHFFRVDWADPTLYHVTCNSSRLPLDVITAAVGEYLGSSPATVGAGQ